jgi:hypothetical protein
VKWAIGGEAILVLSDYLAYGTIRFELESRQHQESNAGLIRERVCRWPISVLFFLVDLN